MRYLHFAIWRARAVLRLLPDHSWMLRALAVICGTAAAMPAAAEGSDSQAAAFVGATLWDGTGAEPIPDAALVVRDGRVEAVGSAEAIDLPEDAEVVELAGRWLIPGLINAHGHVGYARGLERGEEAHTRSNILRQLGLYARYGVTTVVSLGEPGYEGIAIRDRQDRPDLDRSRLFVAGIVMDPETPEEAVAQVRNSVAKRVDWGKIRVDDWLGQIDKMDPETYRAVIAEAHRHGLPITAHMVTLADAKGLVAAGVDVLGHSVRDTEVDEALIGAMRDREVCLHPTLTREVSTFVYAERPDFLDDPFFLRDADAETVAELETPEQQARHRGEAADYYRAALPTAERNMVMLHDGGVRIAFGTDSGPPGRFQGYFEHMELEMMQQAGMAPRDILRSATSVAADCMALEGVGVLGPGAWADFIVLRADPFADMRNLRQIDAVHIAGNEVPGARYQGD